MKKIITTVIPWVILAAMIILIIPGLNLRITSETQNKNVTISAYYDSIMNKVTEKTLQKTLKDLKNAGINNLTVSEDDINYLVANGEITCIKYNVLCHKYDLESIDMAKFIKETYPEVSYDSHVIIISRDNVKAHFDKIMPLKYTSEEYKKVGEYNNLDIYLLHDGRTALWEYSLGYNEEKIKSLKEQGFEITLTYKVKNYDNLKYIDEIDKIIKKYDVKSFNPRMDSIVHTDKTANPANYKKVAELINNNNMTLVVTENLDQLSNRKYFGYDKVYEAVMGKNGSKKVVRSYESYDESRADSTKYKYKVEQYLNSTVDRNVRFITLTLIEPAGVKYTDCAANTVKAAKLYKEKIEALGYKVNQPISKIDYQPNKGMNGGAAIVIMIMFALLMFEMVFGKRVFKLTLAALILSLVGFFVTLTVIPDSLINYIPSVYAFILPCFTITLALYYIKNVKDKMAMLPCILTTLAITVVTMLIGTAVQAVLLSGIDYYINNDIFRGIKLSLIIPALYTAVVYYFMFFKNNNKLNISLEQIKDFIMGDIKVYYVIVAAVALSIGMYYIKRSGNVNTISSIEQAMRSALTELFAARPRTKEFLIGYPSLVLLVYYMKKWDLHIIKWPLAVGAAILVSSISNSFCHVFTDYSIIVSRTVNGLLVGILVCIVIYPLNAVLINIVKKLLLKFFKVELK